MNGAQRRYEATRDTLLAGRRLSDNDRCSEATAAPTVSVTSFPARIDRLHLTLGTVLRQSMKPREIIVTLADSEFPRRVLPRKIRVLEDRGVSVNWVEQNTRSYKKLIPVVTQYPDRPFVTIDDDVLYPPGWLEALGRESIRQPRTILGMRGTAISGKAAADAVDPYRAWLPATPNTASGRTFLTGMGGILYPPHSLNAIATDLELAQRLCPTADDIWFKAMALLAGTRVMRAVETPAEYHTTIGSQRVSLRAVNVDTGANDRQFAAALSHFDLWPALDL